MAQDVRSEFLKASRLAPIVEPRREAENCQEEWNLTVNLQEVLYDCGRNYGALSPGGW
jgi:hypothetical protein